ncbi:MAG: hypothetical protein PHX15_01920 [Candidatus Nanoarchaeia archaeon]|jgi:hypothetical protein|nr:hypothetical protein [Candidatus Nanoarchaeia archaeon]MDD3993932.1 hypothetical protein [Candidatus Nanoarchaeia archaeon]MDD4563395.1 hypothetical protein [Candidatus Nanoarchaeia archaeon]
MEQINKEPSLESLINNFNYINNLKIPRLTILNLQLYVEHYVNELISTEVSLNAIDEIKLYLSFPQKLRIIKKMKVIDDTQLKILELLNKIRDNLVHELVLDEEKIKKRIKSSKLDFVYGWSYINKEQKRIGKIIDLKKIYKKIDDNISQLFISVILIIGIIYNKLREIKKQEINQFIDLNLIENNKSQIQISVLKIE